MRFFLTELIKTTVDDIVVKDRQNIEVKDKLASDVVTDKDIAVERFIKQKLLERFPKDRFIGEEEDSEKGLSNKRTWVLDPIDGTLNYTKDMPYFGTQLALYEKGVPMLCVIYLPILNEMYYAEQGQGAFLNGKRLKSDPNLSVQKSIITFGDFSKSNPISRPVQVNMMSKLMEEALKIRIQGASSVDFAFVAAGRSGAHVMFSKRIWEISAGLLLCLEAGCVTNVSEDMSETLEGKGVVVAQNSKILEQIMVMLE
ncbi:inositol monophosphatase family protein [Fusibacter ferrireducens]|uniref:Inositol monophosphatase n=1 Tax=Fusibacter ferrireducens TaxID=2785058 RepID=A0ABR9ZRE8_9FIRM|nr:inositol monophosphatase [Fusibacter ferrireducens]MBF4692901.1 inositol monophosphatase [Fusibacter ferrireducens]